MEMPTFTAAAEIIDDLKVDNIWLRRLVREALIQLEAQSNKSAEVERLITHMRKAVAS